MADEGLITTERATAPRSGSRKMVLRSASLMLMGLFTRRESGRA